MNEDTLLQEIADVVQILNAAGASWNWPVDQIGTIALRRWNSFPRRNKSKSPTRDDRIRDLIKGFQAHFEPDIPYTHVDDWRAIVEPIVDVLELNSK
ncbi:MAG: hypothetical protein H6824_11945 [Planctomycetaceae bacterium]|nr:hypothetical protein [Planctomycetaceae bacterium]